MMIMTWKSFTAFESEKQYYKDLVSFVSEDSKKSAVYPKRSDLFRAFDLCPLDKVKVVIFGQDPYHGPNQANGLCFSVQKDQTIPPSLKNIFKEIKSDLDIDDLFVHGCLESWAEQGVLLLNSILTVRDGSPGSHKDKGWEIFTDSAIKLLAEQDRPIVFILWGAFARSKKKLITNNKHLVLESAHPSPLSAYNGFFGSKPFSKTNKYFVDNNMNPIDWKLSDV